MRRKNTRNTKSTPETPAEPRRSSRTSARLNKSPIKYKADSDDDEPLSAVIPKESPRKRGTPSKKSEETITKAIEEHLEADESENVEENSQISQVEIAQNETTESNETSDTTQSDTPQINEVITGNENEEAETETDDVCDEKGKSKGINREQVEEKSEITMNSNASGSTEDPITDNKNDDKNDPEPESVVPHTETTESAEKESINDDVSLEQNDYENTEKPGVKNPSNIENESSNIESESPIISSNENEEAMQETVSEESKNEDSEKEKENLNETESAMEQNEDSEPTSTTEDHNHDVTKSEETKEDVLKNKEKSEETEEGEIVGSKSDDENEAPPGTSQKVEVVKKTPVKIKLRRNSLFETIKSAVESEPPSKKIKWNSSKCLKECLSDVITLGVEDFKEISSELKLADENDIRMEESHPMLPREKTASTSINDENQRTKPEYSKQSSTASSEDQENSNLIGLNRKISIVDDSASKLRPPPSPAKQPVSSVLYISNLVRPFTLKQLRELLERTGTIKEDGFWTDRIKSKCYVQYEILEEAEATRNALHGINWPIGNGKKLIIEYSTEEEMEKARNPPKEVPVAPPPQVTPPRSKTPQKENKEPKSDARNGERQHEDSKRPRRDSERERVRTSTREWDIGKEARKEKSRSRSRDRKRKHSGRRAVTPLEDFIARKQRKLEEAVPQKLMDDLFLRTKTMPCIYWQPLSPDEILVKQQQRLTRMEEHKRRLEENSRGDQRNNRGGREPAGRGGYRRRYD